MRFQNIQLALIVLFVLLCSSTIGAIAQQSGVSENDISQRAEMKTQKMKESLELSEEQVKKVYHIHLEMEARKAELKAQREKFSHEKGRLKEAVQEQKEALRNLLNEDQLKKLKEQIRASKKEHQKLRSEHHQRMNDYYAANIRPVLMEQRSKLERELSQAEKEKISTARREMKEHGFARKVRDKRFDSNRMDRTRASTRGEIRAIAEKHSILIDELLGEIQSHREIWQEELHLLRKDSKVDDMGPDRAGRQGNHLMRKLFSPEGFLLLDENHTLRPERPIEGRKFRRQH